MNFQRQSAEGAAGGVEFFDVGGGDSAKGAGHAVENVFLGKLDGEVTHLLVVVGAGGGGLDEQRGFASTCAASYDGKLPTVPAAPEVAVERA